MHWLRAEFAAGCGSTLWGLNRTLTDAITGTVIVRGRSRDSDETTIQRGCESEETRNSPPPSPLFLSLALCVGIYDERRAGIAQRSESQPHMRWSDKSKLVRTDRCLPDDFQCDQDEDIEIVLGVDWFCLREESPGFISPVKSDPPHGRRPMGGKHCLVQNLGGRSKISCAPEKHSPPNPAPQKSTHQFLTALGLEPGSPGRSPPMQAQKAKGNDVKQANTTPEQP